jgi:hypothetical protein
MAMRVAVIMACVDVEIVDEVDVRIRRMGSTEYVIRKMYRVRHTDDTESCRYRAGSGFVQPCQERGISWCSLVAFRITPQLRHFSHQSWATSATLKMRPQASIP